MIRYDNGMKNSIICLSLFILSISGVANEKLARHSGNTNVLLLLLSQQKAIRWLGSLSKQTPNGVQVNALLTG